MALQRMDHVGVTVEDLGAAKAFFVELGLEVVGEWQAEGRVVDRIIGLDGARSDVAMLQTPDGRSRLELCQFLQPVSPEGDLQAAVNVPGLRHLCFAVDDLDDVVERLQALGGELVGSVEQYETSYRLCYLRGPAGIIVELAQKLG